MRRSTIPLLLLACLAALILACYGPALLGGRQFGYRDSAHFYYPLYQRVQAEWHAGRWPLWEPEENGGMPLLGNPTAAVFYPGKLIYAAFAYPRAVRLYVTAHTLLAFAAMLALMRSWGAGWVAAGLSGLGYAFGVPVLFQYCNVIFLVGAAWLPLGVRGADRWLRLGRRAGLLELAWVLAMEVLGGDPETGYVLGVAAAGYAAAQAMAATRTRGRGRGGSESESESEGEGESEAIPPRSRRWRVVLVVVGLVIVWWAATLILAAYFPALRPPRQPGRPAMAPTWMDWVPWGVAGAWGLAGLFLLSRWRRGGWRSPLPTMLAGLFASALLASGLAAVQLLPTLEFTGQSGRAAGEGPHDLYPFSLEVIRLVEFAWPNAFGTPFRGNRAWLSTVPPARLHSDTWVPSLYLGGLTLVLAAGALGFRGGPPWRGWLSAIAIVSLLASLGEFTGPLLWTRWVPGASAYLGPHDPRDTTTIRLDGYVRDGDGSFYWLLATALPGFRQFRFPSKLLTFTALAVSGLAGLGWDRLMSGAGPGSERRTARIAGGLLALSAVALGIAILGHDRFLGALRGVIARGFRSGFGPLDPVGAYHLLCQSLAQAVVVMSIGLALALRGRRAPILAGAVALIVSTADLAFANARHVLTVPQALFEATPKVVRLIREAEARDPSPGPYRVHRMPLWEPVAWMTEASRDRVGKFVAWERDTIQPKYGLPYGIEYTLALGVAEIYDYEWFFGGFLRAIDARGAQMLGAARGEKIVVYPRRAFDLWTTRYFVVPAFPADWKDEQRGFAAFLPDTERIYPAPDAFEGPGGKERQKDWLVREDLQILRNRNAYPRAWVVHRVRWMKPIVGLDRADREKPMQEILFPDDVFWNDPEQVLFDPHDLAWIDEDRKLELTEYLSNSPSDPSETVTVRYEGPQRVVLDAVLERPGLVVLADVYYPGWRLTIDGEEAPIYRTNRMMRGAAVPSGRHRLVYTYEPRSFALGGRITLGCLGLFGLLAVAFKIRPVSARRSPGPDPGPAPTPLPPPAEVVE